MYNKTAYALGANRSCIRELFEYGRSRAAVVGEENVYDYSLGNPSIPAPAEVNRAIRDILTDTPSLLVHGYTSAVGDLATRQAIADDLNARYGASVRAEDLFIGCGAAPELVAVFRALAIPNAEILAVAPYFPEYRPFVENAGAAFKVVPPDVPGFQIRLDAVEAALTENTAAIIINSPNNPSGVVYTKETLEKLAALLTRKASDFGHPIYIVADEPYRELVYGGVEAPFIPNLYPDRLCLCTPKRGGQPGALRCHRRRGKSRGPRLRPLAAAEGDRPVRSGPPGSGKLRPEPAGALRWPDCHGLRNGEARRCLLPVHQGPGRRRERLFRKGEAEGSAPRPRRRLRLPRLLPYLLLRQL